MCLPKFGMQKSGSSLVSAIEHRVISEGACFLMPTGRHVNNGGLFKFSVPACSHVGRQPALARHPQLFFFSLLDLRLMGVILVCRLTNQAEECATRFASRCEWCEKWHLVPCSQCHITARVTSMAALVSIL